MADKKSQGVTNRRARALSSGSWPGLGTFAERKGIFTAAGLSTGAAQLSTKPIGKTSTERNTRRSVQARLKNFLRFCFDSQWMVRVPQAVPCQSR